MNPAWVQRRPEPSACFFITFQTSWSGWEQTPACPVAIERRAENIRNKGNCYWRHDRQETKEETKRQSRSHCVSTATLSLNECMGWPWAEGMPSQVLKQARQNWQETANEEIKDAGVRHCFSTESIRGGAEPSELLPSVLNLLLINCKAGASFWFSDS